MPSSRRLKATGLIALLTLLVIFYVGSGAKSTHNSPFYTRTVAAMKARQSAEARQDILAEEKQRLSRVEKLEFEHKVAMSVAKPDDPPKPTPSSTLGNANPYDQKPVVPASEGGKPIAGRKMMDGKVVHDDPRKPKDDDGVAKVGNVGPQSSHAVVSDDEDKEQKRAESELNDILRKGPIIIFSKTYCPYSKKAKRILLDEYSITPPPYVVELDTHEIGSALQSALQRMTGRSTVPNILVSGRSIGGGDDVEDLDNDEKLKSTILAMAGKRIMKIEKLAKADPGPQKAEMKFKA